MLHEIFWNILAITTALIFKTLPLKGCSLSQVLLDSWETAIKMKPQLVVYQKLGCFSIHMDPVN